MAIVRFVHFLGSCLWIGGALAALVVTVNASREPVDVRAGAFRLLTQVQTLIVGLGALLTLGSGVLWTMWLVQSGGTEEAAPAVGVWVMLVTGLIGGVLVLFVAVPTAVKMGGLAVPTEDGHLLPAFEYYHRRQMVVSLIATALAIVSLFAGVVFR